MVNKIRSTFTCHRCSDKQIFITLMCGTHLCQKCYRDFATDGKPLGEQRSQMYDIYRALINDQSYELAAKLVENWLNEKV